MSTSIDASRFQCPARILFDSEKENINKKIINNYLYDSAYFML